MEHRPLRAPGVRKPPNLERARAHQPRSPRPIAAGRARPGLPLAEPSHRLVDRSADNGGLGAAERTYFGHPGDKPFVGDFDGDGTDTIGLHRESTGLVYFSNQHRSQPADHQFIFGDPGDRLVAGDWTADGVDTLALFRPRTATFYFRHTNTQGVADATLRWGDGDWLPVGGAFG